MAKRHGRKKHQQIKARGRLNGGTSIRRLAEIGSTMILYHYTTTVGLQKIIESKSIWAFECRFLNDASEFQHGFSIFEKIFASYNPPNQQSKLFSFIQNFFKASSEFRVYVASFCEDSDLLLPPFRSWHGEA
jgi:hypothetical protein